MSISENKERVSLVIDKEHKERLQKIADKEERSLNYIINRAIVEYLNKKNDWMRTCHADLSSSSNGDQSISIHSSNVLPW